MKDHLTNSPLRTSHFPLYGQSYLRCIMRGPSIKLQMSLSIVTLLVSAALSFANSCRQYRFSTNGEHLLNQHLSIKIGTTTEYCHFQMKFPQHKETCTNSSHVTLINDTSLLLETTDVEYKTFYLEYRAGKVGKSVEAIFAGFCQNKSENPIPTTSNYSSMWLVIGAIVLISIVIFIVTYIIYRRHQSNMNAENKGMETGPDELNEALISAEGNSQHGKHKNTEEELEPLRDKMETTCETEFLFLTTREDPYVLEQ
ncbi:uncharacterized protein LOC121395702 isoform X2 [Xenopus laevis]|uniref:Uncharacterized protein LOC121395702 isoform X2 n=1 Tax=Xenopus laevis TaxID=8355 RepID=A0A8J1L8P5_XENLA|nr:uncharacterized protein LOC121395702 isoform X2 [Xenopus laevis]